MQGKTFLLLNLIFLDSHHSLAASSKPMSFTDIPASLCMKVNAKNTMASFYFLTTDDMIKLCLSKCFFISSLPELNTILYGVEWLWNRLLEYWARPFSSLLAPLTHSLARSMLAHSRAYTNEIFIYRLNASISYSFNPLCNPIRHL